MSALVALQGRYTPRVVIGDRYDDGWCSPYLRADLDLPAGEFEVTVKVWNPEYSAFADNVVDLRMGLRHLGSTGPMAPGGQGLVSARLNLAEPQPSVSLSLRSLTEWSPPRPDRRLLGFVLLDWIVQLTD